MEAPEAPGLILACGNPARGDDALGPLLLERLALPRDSGIETFWDYQLQIEYVLDLAGRAWVVFVDAAVSGAEPFDFRPVVAEPTYGFTTHALSPGGLLAVHARTLGGPLPECRLLAIRGYAFEMGTGLTPGAEANLEAALEHLGQWLRRWRDRVACRRFPPVGLRDDRQSKS